MLHAIAREENVPGTGLGENKQRHLDDMLPRAGIVVVVVRWFRTIDICRRRCWYCRRKAGPKCVNNFFSTARAKLRRGATLKPALTQIGSWSVHHLPASCPSMCVEVDVDIDDTRGIYGCISKSDSPSRTTLISSTSLPRSHTCQDGGPLLQRQ